MVINVDSIINMKNFLQKEKLVKYISNKCANIKMVFFPTFVQCRQKNYQRHKTRIHQRFPQKLQTVSPNRVHIHSRN